MYMHDFVLFILWMCEWTTEPLKNHYGNKALNKMNFIYDSAKDRIVISQQKKNQIFIMIL